ncbi:hypothetical protein EMCG_00253 [[Emmonsia] crescens]|uniref:Uncharacterized protein n=1 Tax=[Emmonsia] crescens TaxID=73230 RepID=A0A0G2I0A4_9EURO|nr:hypothetical protein EMCG_00253 [Emmonsia crescens UAMH 3008]
MIKAHLKYRGDILLSHEIPASLLALALNDMRHEYGSSTYTHEYFSTIQRIYDDGMWQGQRNKHIVCFIQIQMVYALWKNAVIWLTEDGCLALHGAEYAAMLINFHWISQHGLITMEVNKKGTFTKIFSLSELLNLEGHGILLPTPNRPSLVPENASCTTTLNRVPWEWMKMQAAPNCLPLKSTKTRAAPILTTLNRVPWEWMKMQAAPNCLPLKSTKTRAAPILTTLNRVPWEWMKMQAAPNCLPLKSTKTRAAPILTTLNRVPWEWMKMQAAPNCLPLKSTKTRAAPILTTLNRVPWEWMKMQAAPNCLPLKSTKTRAAPILTTLNRVPWEWMKVTLVSTVAWHFLE